LPLRRFQGENLHPSLPGWKQCEFKNKNCIRKLLVLASEGVDINTELPADFPRTGPEDAIDWAFAAKPASPPNIVLFVAALLVLAKALYYTHMNNLCVSFFCGKSRKHIVPRE
jgi:hypothetical protein